MATQRRERGAIISSAAPSRLPCPWMNDLFDPASAGSVAMSILLVVDRYRHERINGGASGRDRQLRGGYQ